MDGSPYSLAAVWQQSDWVIRSVAGVLLFMSIACWTVVLSRAIELLGHRKAARATGQFWHCHSYGEALETLGKAGRNNLFWHLATQASAARRHHQTHQQDLHGQLPLAEWLGSCLRGAVEENLEKLQRGLPLLASVGATAPFVGLFGTVWGIYHALVGIGVSGEVAISKVAGPVGEALIMTAFGLLVAIPAVLAFNALTRQNRLLLGRMNRFAHDLQAYFITGGTPGRGEIRLVRETISTAAVQGG
ncbi:MAG: MotA/TolQ/ExbB proton channel family protein [Ketobacteraceae bacterium]|nr:MotA/TolQ/ExbB proton channel family protein [Ketobacteraceae bacterium]